MGIPIRAQEPRIYVDADRAFELIKQGEVLKLAALLARYSTPSDTKRFENNYAHWRNESLNPHQLRDDIEANWTSPFLKENAKKLIESLQLRNPLPPKVTQEQAADAAIEAKWPAAARAATRERLKHSSQWPARFQHATLISRMRDWGNWILDNYKYLVTSKAPGEIGLRFNPPQAGGKDSDLDAILDFKNSVDNANARLVQVCEKGPYAGPMPGLGHMGHAAAGCLETLMLWERVFTETKGTVSQNMRETIQKLIQDYERRKHLVKPR